MSLDRIRDRLVAAEDHMTNAEPLVAAAAEVARQVAQRIGAVGFRNVTGDAAALADDAARLTAVVLDGGRPEPMLALLGAIRGELSRVVAAGTEAVDVVDATLVDVLAAGDQGNCSRAAAYPVRGHRRPHRRRCSIPLSMCRCGLGSVRARPIACRGGRTTRGLRTGACSAGTGLSDSLRSHVEAHIAAAMRRGEVPHDAVVVLNNRTCRGPLSCDTFLPSIMPDGARLTVFVTDGKRVWPGRTYYGTGERIGGR